MPWRSPWWCRVLPAAAAASCERERGRHTATRSRAGEGSRVLQRHERGRVFSAPRRKASLDKCISRNRFRTQGLLSPPAFCIYEERNLKEKKLAKAFAVLPEEGHMGLCSNADPVLLMRFCYCIMDNHRYHHISGDCFKLLWWLLLWSVLQRRSWNREYISLGYIRQIHRPGQGRWL